MRRRAVLTGGAGFVGSHLAERLLEQDIDVICLDNFVTGAEENVAHLQGSDGFRLLKVDVSDYISIPGPVDYVLHFASPASPIDYAELPIQTMKAGSLGTLHTLGLAKDKGARFLLASTSETYGDPLVHPQHESYWGNVNPVGPRACYDEAKRFAEALTTSYRMKHGVNTAIMRIFNTYGPRMRPDDGRAIPNFVNQALAGEPITVHGDGSQTRSVCHVDDLVEGALRLLFSDLTGPVNIGNPHEMTVLELANLIRELAGSQSPVEYTERGQDDPSQRRPTSSWPAPSWAGSPRSTCERVCWRPSHGSATALTPARTAAPLHRCSGGARSSLSVRGTRSPSSAPAMSVRSRRPALPHLDTTCAASTPTRQGPSSSTTARRRSTSPGFLRCSPRRCPPAGCGSPTGPPRRCPTRTLYSFASEHLLARLGHRTYGSWRARFGHWPPHLRPGVVIVNKSTVPVGSGNWTRTILEEALPGGRQLFFHVVSNPEFLREGCAIDDFLYPDRIVLGGDPSDVHRVAELYQPVLDQSFDGGRRQHQPALITTELHSAEMIKYAANAFLATKISFANEIAQLCELVGADVREVLPAIGADHRVGAAFLNPGVGWGGSCFGKDVAGLISTGQEYGYTPTMLQATVNINMAQRATAVRKLQRELHVLKGRRIALLGLTFKPGTDDLRDAPALDVARHLLAAGAVVSAFDPVVKALPEEFAPIRLGSDAYDAADRVDAVVLMTEWPEFRFIDAAALRRVMRGDLVVDGRNFLQEADFAGSGLRLIGFGW